MYIHILYYVCLKKTFNFLTFFTLGVKATGFNVIHCVQLIFYELGLDLGEGSLTMIVCNDYCNHQK